MANTALWQSVSRNGRARSAAAISASRTIVVEGFGHGELLAAQIVRSVCPVADGAVVAAAAALPADRCVWLSADHDDAARAATVGGRRRHGRALSQAVPASPAVAAATMLARCSPSRRAGPGVSAGRSRKWCRSATNMAWHCSRSGVGGSRYCSVGAASLAGMGQPVGGGAGFDDLLRRRSAGRRWPRTGVGR